VQRANGRADDGGDGVVVLRVVDGAYDLLLGSCPWRARMCRTVGTVSSRYAPEYQPSPAYTTLSPSWSAAGTRSATKHKMGPSKSVKLPPRRR
jgi:hypothetical protein